MTTQTLPAMSRRLPGWLLAVSPLGFVLVIAASVATFSTAGIGLFDDITRPQMDSLGAQWTVYCLTVLVAYGIGNLGIILLRHEFPDHGRRWAIGAAILAAASGLAAIAFTFLRIASAAFTEQRLGDNGLYAVSDILAVRLHDVATAAMVLACVGLYVSGLRRKTGLIVGILATAYFVANLLGGFAPPFIISFLWLAIGVSWLRGTRRQA